MKHSQIMGIITLTLIIGMSTIPTVDAKEKKHHVTKISQNKTKKHYIKKPVYTQSVGLASWYGYESGPTTANGAKFDPKKMTAAHRTLPFGTKVLVTNLKNNKSVVVEINDRGPAIKSRVIDLSARAAKLIGITGIGKVSITIV
jgi:rare lipoprotein A